MALGLLAPGMTVGAAVAAAWLLSGGSVLGAVALYGLVGSGVVLAAAVLAFRLSERKERAEADRLHPAE